MRFETTKRLQPFFEPARFQQGLAKCVVRLDVFGASYQHPCKCADRCIDPSLIAENDADVVLSRGHGGIQRQRTLIGTQGARVTLEGLQRHAVVVVRLGVSWSERQCTFECIAGIRAMVLGEFREAERAPQRRLVGRQRQSLTAVADRSTGSVRRP